MKKLVARHGDVLVFTVNEIPEGLEKKIDVNNHILAYGEVSGHSHRVVVETEKGFEKPTSLEFFQGEDGNTYIKAPQKFYLDHEEHGVLGDIGPGNYVAFIKREKDHMEDVVRKVVD